jgi:Holliday junction DNA helicase RuvA
MIYKLTGKVEHILPTAIVVDVNGVGYQIEMPLSDLCHLPSLGEKIEVWVYTYVREDALRLFGFRTFAQRHLFETLISINGVGPKVALAMLSTLDPSAIRVAAFEGRVEVLESVPGIGKRTAERLLIELKPKLQKLSGAMFAKPTVGVANGFDFVDEEINEQVFEDLRSALENFGYKRKLVDPIIARLAKENAEGDFQALMRMALIHLRPASKPEGQL